MELIVNDMVVRRRKVVLPDECPHCGKSLSEKNSVDLITVEAVTRTAGENMTQLGRPRISGHTIRHQIVAAVNCRRCGTALADSWTTYLSTEQEAGPLKEQYEAAQRAFNFLNNPPSEREMRWIAYQNGMSHLQRVK